jgi:cardiolipin synthase
MIYFGLIGYSVLEMMGIASAVHVVWKGRTSQGAVAWALSLVSFPLLALPLYWVFGRSKFHGYVESMRKAGIRHAKQIQTIITVMQTDRVVDPSSQPPDLKVFRQLAGFPFTTGNRVALLVDGAATFDAIFKSIDGADQYVLVQFFIVYDDQLGRQLKDRMARKARQGVRVHFLYDEIGSHKLPAAYLDDLLSAGVNVSGFKTTRGPGNRFQLNFRNHRKIVVVDGQTAFVGGHNVGDAYLGRSRRFGHWRDTHIEITGPAVRNVQASFLKDWYWATRQPLELDWRPQPPETGAVSDLAVVASGPADEMETCSLMFVHAINSARKRFWLASPYFVPDGAVVEALQLAALRGVDVRILLPLKPDHRVVYLASFWYIRQMTLPNIRFFRYAPGFLHQKVMLVDDHLAAVGTANADSRSFRLNFEITVIGACRQFAGAVNNMLVRDFQRARLVTAEDYHRRHVLFKLGVKFSRLLSPIL